MSGEIPSLLGAGIKEQCKNRGYDNTAVVGYTNGVITYIPTNRILDEGGYERDVFMYMRLTGPFEKGTEEKIYDQIDKVLTVDYGRI